MFEQYPVPKIHAWGRWTPTMPKTSYGLWKPRSFTGARPKTWTLVVHPRREGLRIAEKGSETSQRGQIKVSNEKKPTRKRRRRIQRLHNKGGFLFPPPSLWLPCCSCLASRPGDGTSISHPSPSISMHRCKLRNLHSLFCKGGAGGVFSPWQQGKNHQLATITNLSYRTVLSACVRQVAPPVGGALKMVMDVDSRLPPRLWYLCMFLLKTSKYDVVTCLGFSWTRGGDLPHWRKNTTRVSRRACQMERERKIKR